jgi:hypothetical protein
MEREHLSLTTPDRLAATRARVADLYQERQQRQAQDFVDVDSSPAPRRPLPTLSSDQLEGLRRRVQAISEARERQRALDPPIAVPVDELEVEQIGRWLDELAQEPGEWPEPSGS